MKRFLFKICSIFVLTIFLFSVVCGSNGNINLIIDRFHQSKVYYYTQQRISNYSRAFVHDDERTNITYYSDDIIIRNKMKSGIKEVSKLPNDPLYNPEGEKLPDPVTH